VLDEVVDSLEMVVQGIADQAMDVINLKISKVGVFLHYSPITVKRLAREGKIPAHSISNGVRKRWRFLISELATTMRREVSLNHHPRRLHKEEAAYERKRAANVPAWLDRPESPQQGS
jgi:hypothetical protein